MKTIERPDALTQILGEVERSPWAAVDTEADSLHHYVEKLCLVQVSLPGEDYVIDPLAGVDLAMLARLLGERPLIFHGADFDIRMLTRFTDFSPSVIFDTMVAAQLLGYEKQGFADLAERHCGVKLSKKAQRADWSVRPLSEELLTYAANDTHYLKPIADKMREELVEKGRLEWHRQSCERVMRSAMEEKEAKNPPELRWQVKGSKALGPSALTVLRELWNWREEEARRRDRPTFKVLHNETLVQIADWSSKENAPDVAALPNAPRNVRREYRDSLNAVVERARALPPTPYTAKKPKEGRKRWTNRAETFLKLLKEERERLARELKLAPSLLATNAVLEEFSSNPPSNQGQMVGQDLLMPWQAGVVGESFLKVFGKP